MLRRSKLEVNLDIMKILASRGPMKPAQLIDKANLSHDILKQHLDFLTQQNLVEEQNLGKHETFYVVTERGLKVLKIVIPMISEVRKIPALLR
jgi:predicted transcriptional regulator